MKRAKIIVISGSALGVVLFAGAAFMLYRGVTGFNKSRHELDELKARMERYYKAPVFPSLANVKVETENAKQVDIWFSELMTKLAKGNVISTDRSPSHFITAGTTVRRNLLKRAREAGTVLPDGNKFAFGFERYTGADGVLPKPDDIPRLIEQLAIVNGISSILFESGIKEVKSIKRDVFESTAGDADITTTSARSRRSHRNSRSRSSSGGGSSASPSVSNKNVGIIKDDALFAKMHFVFEFRAKEKALIDILNAFAKSKMFIVVTSIKIMKKTPDLMPKVSEPVIKDDISGSEESIFDEPSTPKKKNTEEKPKLGPNYPVCGIKMEIPMEIHLELDVYKFKEARFDSGH